MADILTRNAASGSSRAELPVAQSGLKLTPAGPGQEGMQIGSNRQDQLKASCWTSLLSTSLPTFIQIFCRAVSLNNSEPRRFPLGYNVGSPCETGRDRIFFRL